MFGIVYLVRNLSNGKGYVGITTKTLKWRWSSHKKASGKGRFALHKAMKKYGHEAFDVSELERCDSRDALNSAEMRWVAALKTKAPSGYNLTDGGGGISGFKQPPGFGQKVADRRRGYVMSDESRKKISDANKGAVRSDAYRALVSKMVTGRKHSAETKAKISAGNKGKVISAEAIQKMRLTKIGVPSPDHVTAMKRRPVVAAGVTYQSISDAASALGVSLTTIDRRIRDGLEGYKSLGLRKPRAKRTPEQCLATRERLSVPVIAGGVRFSSSTEAARSLGIARPTLRARMLRGWEGYGWLDGR